MTTGFSRILLATNLAPETDRAMERTVRLAVEGGGDLAVVCVRPAEGGGPLPHLSPDGLEAEIRRHLDAVPAAAALSPTVRHLVGVVEEEVAAFAARWGADLLVVGSTRAEADDGLFAISQVERLSVNSRPPLLVVRGKPFAPYASALVPVDFGEMSRPAVLAARKLLPLGGGLRLLHVVDLPSPGAGIWPVSSFASEFAQVVEGVDLTGLAVGHEIRCGVPMIEISAAARVDPPELLVMGTAGRRGLSRVLLGSTAHDLLEHQPCDVLLVRA